VWHHSIQRVQAELYLTPLNLDSSHSLAKKGGEQVAYQQRKLAKTSYVLALGDCKGYIIASTGIVAGNHQDSFELKTRLQTAFKTMKRLGLRLTGAFFNADSTFNTKAAAKSASTTKSSPILLKTPQPPAHQTQTQTSLQPLHLQAMLH